MARSRYGYVLIAVATAAGMGAWATRGGPPVTEPAPVDRLSEEVVAEAPEVDAPSPVRFASQPLETTAPRAEWDLPPTLNDRVRYWIDFLKGDNHDRTHLWLEREGKYGGYIRSQLRARAMPEDLLYLSMIESGLSPRAYSHAHASGLWQFIAGTGRQYGLEISSFLDERRDPIAATDAALDYLSDLYDRFGSWYLAAAAYNSGENRVERILRQRAGGQRGDDALFWRIDGYLPRETRDYVPLMLAAGYIGKNPNEYGFYGIEHQAPLAFDEVRVPGGVSLAAVAKAADVTVDAVKDLNPHLVRGMTPPGRAWPVRVPVGQGEGLAGKLEQLAEEDALRNLVHRVRRGETLSHIARHYGVEVEMIRAANGWLNPRRLQVGQRLQVPVRGGKSAASASGTGTVQWTTYRVRSGDTLWAIARRHDVTVNELRRWNGIGSRIYPGQRIRIAA